MTRLTKAIVTGAKALVEPVDVPEWDGDAYVRLLDGEEAKQAMAWYDARGEENGNAEGVELQMKIVCLCLSDDRGERVFSDEELDEVRKIPFVITQRITAKALAFNGLTEESAEEITKN